MKAQKIAEDFIRTMNPERVTDGTANFGIYEVLLNHDKYNLELCFVEEDFDDGKPEFRTAIDLVDKHSTTVDYTFVETMTDAEAIANGIQYLFEEHGVQ